MLLQKSGHTNTHTHTRLLRKGHTSFEICLSGVYVSQVSMSLICLCLSGAYDSQVSMSLTMSLICLCLSGVYVSFAKEPQTLRVQKSPRVRAKSPRAQGTHVVSDLSVGSCAPETRLVPIRATQVLRALLQKSPRARAKRTLDTSCAKEPRDTCLVRKSPRSLLHKKKGLLRKRHVSCANSLFCKRALELLRILAFAKEPSDTCLVQKSPRTKKATCAKEP